MACYAEEWNLQAFPAKSAPVLPSIRKAGKQFNQSLSPLGATGEATPERDRSSEAVRRAIGSALEDQELGVRPRDACAFGAGTY